MDTYSLASTGAKTFSGCWKMMLGVPQCSWQTMEKCEKPTAVWVTRNGKIRKPSSRMLDLMFTSIYLKEYFSYVLSCTQHFPEMKAAIKNRQQSNVARNEATSSAPSSTSGEDDEHHLVGFGPYKLMSHFNLYNSTQDEHMRYVTSILNTNATYPGGQLDKLKRYIEKEDRRRQISCSSGLPRKQSYVMKLTRHHPGQKQLFLSKPFNGRSQGQWKS